MRLTIILHLCLLISSYARAQFCGSINYGGSEGLGGEPFMGMLQDSKGYLWVGTYNSGVYRFDAKNWKNFSTNHGLLNNRVNIIIEDKEGGIWLVHENGATRLLGGKYVQYRFDNTSYLQDYTNKLIPYYQLVYDPLQHTPAIFLYKEEKGMVKGLVSTFDYKTKTFITSSETRLPAYLLKPGSLRHISFSFKGEEIIVAYKKNGKINFHIAGKNEVQLPPTPAQLGVDSFISIRDEYSNNLIYKTSGYITGSRKGLMQLKGNKWELLPKPIFKGYGASMSSSLNMDMTTVFVDRRKSLLMTLWVIDDPRLKNARLIAEYDLHTFEFRKSTLFSSFSIPDYNIIKDKAGTYWVSTSARVMRLLPDQMIISADAPGMLPSTWSVAQAPDGKMWFATYGFGLWNFDGLYLSPPPAAAPRSDYYLDGSLTDKRGNMYFNLERNPPGILITDGKNKWEIWSPDALGYYLSYDKKGRLMWGTNGRGLWLLPQNGTLKSKDDWLKIDASKGLKLLNVITASDDRYGRYWMGRPTQGIAMYDPKKDTVYNWLKEEKVAHYGLMSMAEDAKGNLWLGTDRGLCFLENRPDIDGTFDPLRALQRVALDYLGESVVSVCKLYDEHTLIVGNSIGYFLLDLDDWYATPRKLHVRSYTKQTGYGGAAVVQNGVCIDRNRDIWLTGSDKVIRHSPDLIGWDNEAPTVKIDSIVVQNKVYTVFDKTLFLQGKQHSGRIYFSHPINPFLFDNIKYRYRMSGDTAWSALTDVGAVDFSNLSFGEYTFEVVAVKEGLDSEPAAVTFRIALFWWQNPLFWLAIIGAVVLAALYLRRKERKIHDQEIQLEKTKVEMEAMSKEKNKLQVQAIVNQLNPHFINNALHWLQVRLDEDAEALSVVGKLSENISTVFKNSRMKKAYHALQDELKLTQSYLFIQKCRFRDKLDYEMPPNEIVQKVEAINVPLMIVQIHVENAVEHGIRNRSKGGGTVRIKLREDKEYVVITIEDDGVGRIAAKRIGSKGTQQGTKMLEELEAIYNLQNELSISQHYDDEIFEDDSGKCYGTRVTVRIPKNYNYEL